ncbi:37S ribosomal protein S25, mitochondrial [Metschnikowia bicuspidata]|uniref:37S ribosomal protein S25, mitochondrial n=1 Tax=Metschnikowia bicuspidata TaxID=27322 RepID=A0A4P9ZEK8_9ASCO|nr:37S ribosomal protein S25, mitochondrial [Metschnikowia bicuspidata]
MKIQREATRVLQLTSQLLKAGVIKQKPAWFDVVAANPPAMDLTKKPKSLELNQDADPLTAMFVKNGTDFYRTRAKKEDVKQKNNSTIRIPKIELFEDQLRDVFFHQHPWEFSRPKYIVENKGTDAEKCDWSHMAQFLKPLDGESVVQRTIWLLKDSKENGQEKTLFEAYDEARFEFYQLRMAEEADAFTSREESAMYGAVYPTSYYQKGVEMEQPHVDGWANLAEEKMQYLTAARNNVSASVGLSVSEDLDLSSVWDFSIHDDEAAASGNGARNEPQL